MVWSSSSMATAGGKVSENHELQGESSSITDVQVLSDRAKTMKMRRFLRQIALDQAPEINKRKLSDDDNGSETSDDDDDDDYDTDTDDEGGLQPIPPGGAITLPPAITFAPTTPEVANANRNGDNTETFVQVGIGIGVLAAVLFVFGAMLVLYRRHQKKNPPQQTSHQNAERNGAIVYAQEVGMGRMPAKWDNQ